MMIHLPENCTGCRTCQLLCSLKRDGECNPSLSRIVLDVDGLHLTDYFGRDIGRRELDELLLDYYDERSKPYG